MEDVFDLFTAGLVQAGIFTDSATGSHLRSILPQQTVSKIEAVTKSGGTAGTTEEKGMADMSTDQGDLGTDLDLPAEVTDYIAELEAKVVSLSKAQGIEDEMTEVLKSVDPAVAEIIKSQSVRLQEAEEALAVERAERIRKTYLEKAERYPHIIEDGSQEFLADTLQEVAAFAPEAASRMEAILEVAESRLAKSNLFAEVGFGGDASYSGSAYEKATAIAKSLVDSGTESSIESARASVWESHPELFDEYQRERVLGQG